MSLEEEQRHSQEVSPSYLEINIFPPMVLEMIFSHLGVEDLKHARQVCSGWRTEATRLLKKKVILMPSKVMEQGESGDGPNVGSSTSSSEDVDYDDDELEVVEALRSQQKSQADARRQLNYFKMSLEKEPFPVENIRIECLKLQEDANEEDSAITMEKWVSKFGPSLRMIDYKELRSCEEIEKKEMGHLSLLQLLKNCPALEQLVLRDIHCLKTQMLTFPLTILPNLKKVQFISTKLTRYHQRRCATEETEELVQFLKNVFRDVEEVLVDVDELYSENKMAVLRAIIEKGEGTSLKTLEWKGTLSNRDLKTFIDLPKLESVVLNCSVIPVPMFTNDFYNFLERQKEGLKRLEILGLLHERWDEHYLHYGGVYLRFIGLRIPMLPSLVTFVLEDICHLRLPVRNIYEYIQNMPALRQLVLRNIGYASDGRNFGRDDVLRLILHQRLFHDVYAPHLKLEHLEIYGEMMTDSVSSVTQNFPNLKAFTAIVNSDDVFQEMFRCCSTFIKLERLDISFRNISNMSSSNSAMGIYLPKMPALKTFHLKCNESFPFQLDTSTLTTRICGVPKIRRICLQNVSMAGNDRDSIFRILEEKNISFWFRNCSFYFPSFDIAYEGWGGSKNPLPHYQLCPQQE